MYRQLSRVAQRALQPAAADAGGLLQARRALATGPSKVTELQTKAQYESALKELQGGSGLAVIDFTAAWCGPCKMIAPVYEGLAQEFEGVQFFKVDIDSPELSSVVVENNITAVPTFVAYAGLERVGAMSGADRAALRQLVTQLTGAAA